MTEFKFLLLSEYESSSVYKYLSSIGSTKLMSGKIELKYLFEFDWIISYGYKHIIQKEIIQAVKNPIINLHISYLPFNRGVHPNYWSFKEQSQGSNNSFY